MKIIIKILFVVSLFILGMYALWYFNAVKPVKKVEVSELQYDIDLARSMDGEVYINIDDEYLLYLLGEQLFPGSAIRGKVTESEVILLVRTNAISWVKINMSAEDGKLVVDKVSFSYFSLGKNYTENVNDRITRMYEDGAVFEFATLDKIVLKDGTNEIVLKAEQFAE